MNEHYLYLISEGDNGPVKVGISGNPWARCMELQQGNSRRLRLAFMWPCRTRTDARHVEREILESNSRFRLVGEWLEVSEPEAVVVAASYFEPDGIGDPAGTIIDRFNAILAAGEK